jgi:hypothetical protein
MMINSPTLPTLSFQGSFRNIQEVSKVSMEEFLGEEFLEFSREFLERVSRTSKVNFGCGRRS